MFGATWTKSETQNGKQLLSHAPSALASLTSNKYGVGGRQKVAFVSECVSRNVFSPCFPTSFNDFAQTPLRLQVISFKISRIFFSCAYGTVVMALAGQIKQNVQSDAPKIRTCESVWLTQCLFLMLFCIIFIHTGSLKNPMILHVTLLKVLSIFFARACSARGANYK